MNDRQQVVFITLLTWAAMYGIVSMLGGNWSPTQWSVYGKIAAIILLIITFNNILLIDKMNDNDSI